MKKFIFITISIVSLFASAEFEDRKKMKEKIFEGCKAMYQASAQLKKDVCECLVENFELNKVTDGEMEMLASAYNPNKKKRTEELKEGTALSNFRYEVGTKCIEKPSWRMKDDEPFTL